MTRTSIARRRSRTTAVVSSVDLRRHQEWLRRTGRQTERVEARNGSERGRPSLFDSKAESLAINARIGSLLQKKSERSVRQPPPRSSQRAKQVSLPSWVTPHPPRRHQQTPARRSIWPASQQGEPRTHRSNNSGKSKSARKVVGLQGGSSRGRPQTRPTAAETSATPPPPSHNAASQLKKTSRSSQLVPWVPGRPATYSAY